MRGVESNASDFLPPDVAFRVGASVDGNVVRVRWVIADGLLPLPPQNRDQGRKPDLAVAAPVLPQGVLSPIPISEPRRSISGKWKPRFPSPASIAGAHPLQNKVTYQAAPRRALLPAHQQSYCFPAMRPPPQSPRRIPG